MLMYKTNNSNKKSIPIPSKNISLKIRHPMFLRHPIHTCVFEMPAYVYDFLNQAENKLFRRG